MICRHTLNCLQSAGAICVQVLQMKVNACMPLRLEASQWSASVQFFGVLFCQTVRCKLDLNALPWLWGEKKKKLAREVNKNIRRHHYGSAIQFRYDRERRRDTGSSGRRQCHRGRWHLKCIAVVVVLYPITAGRKMTALSHQQWKKQQREKERHLQSEQETIPVMAHCVHDKHNEPIAFFFWAVLAARNR